MLPSSVAIPVVVTTAVPLSVADDGAHEDHVFAIAKGYGMGFSAAMASMIFSTASDLPASAASSTFRPFTSIRRASAVPYCPLRAG